MKSNSINNIESKFPPKEQTYKPSPSPDCILCPNCGRILGVKTAFESIYARKYCQFCGAPIVWSSKA